MTFWHIAALVTLTLATNLGAERNCKQGFDTSSMLAMVAEFELANDAASEPNDEDNTDAFPTISYAQDAILPDEDTKDNDQSASANIAALEVKSTERRSWTESFVGALADHPVLPTPTDNVTGSSLKVNAEAYLMVGTIEAIGVFLFTVVVCGCVCFCTIRHAQTQAHATAYNADIRERLRTKSIWASAASRASFDSGFSRSSLGSRSSWTCDVDLSGEEEDEDDEELEEEEESEETEDPADKKENQKFEGGLVQSKVAKEISDNAIKEKGSKTIRFKD